VSAPTVRLAAAAAVARCAVAAALFLLAIGASDPASAAAGVAIELVLAGWLAAAGRPGRGVAVACAVLALCAASAGALIWGLHSDSNWI